MVVPHQEAERALIELGRVQAYEQERMAQIARGEHIPAWVDRIPVLAERGAQIRDGPLKLFQLRRLSGQSPRRLSVPDHEQLLEILSILGIESPAGGSHVIVYLVRRLRAA